MDDQAKLEKLIIRLENYNAKNKKIEEKNKVLESAVKLFRVRKDIIDFFKKGVFPFKGNVFKTKEEESEENKLEKIKDDYKNFFKYIEDELKSISYKLFKKHFHFVSPTAFTKQLYETKNKNKNNELVNVIKSGLIDLKDETEKMSKEEIENEKPNDISEIVDEIFDFNKEIQKQPN